LPEKKHSSLSTAASGMNKKFYKNLNNFSSKINNFPAALKDRWLKKLPLSNLQQSTVFQANAFPVKFAQKLVSGRCGTQHNDTQHNN
jgi:hypothetical protein